MNSTDQFLFFFQSHGNILTLGEILQTHHAAEYRKHISLLRQKGYKIECKLNRKEPGKNTYYLTNQVKATYQFEDSGQAVMFG